MSRKQTLAFLSAGVLASVLLLVIWTTSRMLVAFWLANEGTSKSEWSVLQGVEFKHRGIQLHDGIVVEKVGVNETTYLVLGIPLKEKDNSTWILLNPNGTPWIKQLPKVENYRIREEDLERIRLIPGINQNVMSELEMHLDVQ